MIPDASAFQAWLRGRVGFEGVVVRGIEAAEGGASNITCRAWLTGAGIDSVALRVQRDRGIFEPYDVVREGRVVAALANSAVPVPAMVGSEPDARTLGAPFIVMEWVDAPHMGVARDASFEAFTNAVVEVHRTNWQGLGLAFLGVPRSAREGLTGAVDRVAGRMAAARCADDPLLARAAEALRKGAPDDGTLSFCQGDINVFNYLFRSGEVVAVVDWEQAHIGDLRSDVGQLLALSHLKGAPWMEADAMPFAQAYGAVAGMELRGMAYFRAFWLFQLAVIYRGWVSFNDSEPWYGWDAVSGLLDVALSELA